VTGIPACHVPCTTWLDIGAICVQSPQKNLYFFFLNILCYHFNDLVEARDVIIKKKKKKKRKEKKRRRRRRRRKKMFLLVPLVERLGVKL
jgi:transposase